MKIKKLRDEFEQTHYEFWEHSEYYPKQKLKQIANDNILDRQNEKNTLHDTPASKCVLTSKNYIRAGLISGILDDVTSIVEQRI